MRERESIFSLREVPINLHSRKRQSSNEYDDEPLGKKMNF